MQNEVKSDLGNPSFDVVRHACYNHRTTAMLNVLRSKDSQARTKYASTWGLALGPPNPFDSLAFDRHIQDPAHLLLQNLSKYLISATLGLLSSIGTKIC